MFKISTGPELAHQPMAISPSLSSRKKKIFTLLHTFIRLVELCLIKNTYIHPVSFFLIICESFLTFILRKKFSSKISSSLKYYFFCLGPGAALLRLRGAWVEDERGGRQVQDDPPAPLPPGNMSPSTRRTIIVLLLMFDTLLGNVLALFECCRFLL